MPNLPTKTFRFLIIASSFAVTATAVRGETAKSRFIFKDAQGKSQSAEIVTKYQPKKIVNPIARVDSSIAPKLCCAATLAQERARAHSRSRCWQYVKEALLASGVISSYPKTEYAKEAGQELVSSYGFQNMLWRGRLMAPVYAASPAAGHVELRTKDGFVSDFRSKSPSPRPLIGVYAKL